MLYNKLMRCQFLSIILLNYNTVNKKEYFDFFFHFTFECAEVCDLRRNFISLQIWSIKKPFKLENESLKKTFASYYMNIST